MIDRALGPDDGSSGGVRAVSMGESGITIPTRMPGTFVLTDTARKEIIRKHGPQRTSTKVGTFGEGILDNDFILG